MKRLVPLVAMLLLFAATALQAEDSCKIYAHPMKSATPTHSRITVQGTLLNATSLQLPDGTVVPLVDTPGLTGVRVPPGNRASLIGYYTDDKAFQVETLSVNDNVTHLFPIRGRCCHCGCRMQVDTPEQLQEKCTMCNCGHTMQQCMEEARHEH